MVNVDNKLLVKRMSQSKSTALEGEGNSFIEPDDNYNHRRGPLLSQAGTASGS